jgi:hypothetical protein
MKKTDKALENISEEHALAAAILADLPYVVASPAKPKKEKKKKVKAPQPVGQKPDSASEPTAAQTLPPTPEEPSETLALENQHVAKSIEVTPVIEPPAIEPPAIQAKEYVEELGEEEELAEEVEVA